MNYKKKFLLWIPTSLVLALSLFYVSIANGQTFSWPVNQSFTVTQGYSAYNQVPSVAPNKYHTGIDLTTTNGAVLAAASGWVHAVHVDGAGSPGDGWGNAIIIRHPDGEYSLYAHLADPLPFSDGDYIPAGTQLGTMGKTGKVTGIHLHFEIKSDGLWGPGYTLTLPDVNGYFDPWKYIASSGITLSFPLGGRNPYTVKITSSLDHSGRYYCNSDKEIVAYTGEKGVTEKPGDLVNVGCALYGYRNVGDTDFVVNGQYVDTSTGSYPSEVLYYDGHPGYDYACTAGEAVLSAASGTLIIPDSDPINGNGSLTTFNTFKIDHGGGWETWYLHTRNNIPSGPVSAGTSVAECWNTGISGVHLHFEVRRNGKIVDPYGWEWHTADPLYLNQQAEVQLNPLWGIPQPEVTDVTLAGSYGNFTATINGQYFSLGALVTLWDRYGQFFVQKITPDSVSGTQITATLPITNPENYVLKVKNPSGPRSKGKTISSSPSSSFNQLAIIGTPAPGGGTFSSFATFYGMNNFGDVVFSAEVDTDADGLGDEARTVQFSGGQFSTIAVSGITKIGAAKINDDGDIAFGDASIPGRTQAIYSLKAGTSTPIKIAEWGQASPISGTTYYDLRGPHAINMNGDVTFSSEIYDTSTSTSFCCYLFLYLNSDGSVKKVVGKGESTPVGGTFDIYVPTNQITDDGDVIFLAGLKNVTATSGIFRFSSQSLAINKIVAEGDPAPTSIGGNLAYSFFSPISSVSGRKFVFQSNISGGTSSQAIFVKDNVQLDSLADIRVIVQDGQTTNTEVAGRFARQDYPSGIEPFSVYGNPPQIRTDGGIVFFSLLQNASIGGLPTQKGIFLWSGKEFKKVAVVGESLPSGGTLGGLNAFTFNDIGQVVFFVPSIN